jgi:hypothetical protein
VADCGHPEVIILATGSRYLNKKKRKREEGREEGKEKRKGEKGKKGRSVCLSIMLALLRYCTRYVGAD